MIPLNEYGLAIWRHKTNHNLFLQKSYGWVDRVLTIDESKERQVIADDLYSEFDFSDWVPLTAEEFTKVKQKYSEIYD